MSTARLEKRELSLEAMEHVGGGTAELCPDTKLCQLISTVLKDLHDIRATIVNNLKG